MAGRGAGTAGHPGGIRMKTFRGCDGRRIRKRRETEEETLQRWGLYASAILTEAVCAVVFVIAVGFFR